jgi:DNA mismatch repair protein MutS
LQFYSPIMSDSTAIVETPLMKQYYGIKAKYPDAILLFRVGDFYETFGEDAIKTSAVVGIVLTKRANGAAAFIELAGFPHHALDTYLPKLVRAGYRVAICDQLEDPKLTKKIVKRGVTELISPGVSYNDKILEHKKNNFLAAIHFGDKQSGVSFIDISTGEFLCAQGDLHYIEKLIQNFNPSEIIYARPHKKLFSDQYHNKFHSYILDEWIFKVDYAKEILQKHFNTLSLKGYGIDDQDAAIIAAGAAFYYVSDTRQENLKHINSISRVDENSFVWLDKFSIRNLELINSVGENGKSLIDVVDHTISPMGARLIKRWLLMPLKNVAKIEERLNAVSYLQQQHELNLRLSNLIKPIGDLERIISKVALGKILPREILQLQKALVLINEIKLICNDSSNSSIRVIGEQLNACTIIADRILKEIHPDAPAVLSKGNIINSGVNDALDELKAIAFHGKDFLMQLQQQEAERTGISSLKVGFNNVFGYYLEVTHAHKEKVPENWIRKQTLTNAERYITPTLKEYEEKILGAEEKIAAIEIQLYQKIIAAVTDYIQPIQHNAAQIAQLDVLLNFANIAIANHYIKPLVDESFKIELKGARHPVIEKNLSNTERYIANDLYLDNESQQLIMITGPNMSGKSALLRQTALIVLMAQAGCFVPATHAQIGIVDKIFTRVGATDNISSGESTFMVEMNETASILHNLSNRSLVLLDEIGRGTATYDGISIAWAIAEYIHEHPLARAKTLFATHYHELNEMEKSFLRIKNYHVSVKEVGSEILFLRKLVAGGSEHSFGIHVAKLAGIPAKVVAKAETVLQQLELNRSIPNNGVQLNHNNGGMQLSFFQLDDPVLAQIKQEIAGIDINNLTPIEALNKLNEIKKHLGK